MREQFVQVAINFIENEIAKGFTQEQAISTARNNGNSQAPHITNVIDTYTEEQLIDPEVEITYIQGRNMVNGDFMPVNAYGPAVWSLVEEHYAP